jgi:NhaA family Na+:H+ antiporter
MSTGVPPGIMAGLILGKQIGVFGFSWVAIKLGLAKLSDNSTWLQLYGVSILTGIGFTMSLFVDSLAFTDGNLYQQADKLAVLAASFTAGIAGYLVLRVARLNSD